MKISCTKENLARALALISGVTGKNVNLPILSNVLIKADEQKVEVIATNLELAVVVAIRAKVEEPGSFTVPARTLADFVNLLSSDKIDFELKDSELLVVCGKSSTKIKGTVADDFPIIPKMEEGKGFLVKAFDLHVGLGQVLPAVARNDIRPELAGVFFGFNVGKELELVLAATDSYRLAEKKLPLKQGGEVLKVVVPGRAAQEIARVVAASESGEAEENVRVLVNENQIMVSYGNAQVLSRLVEGSYPDYTQIIPKEFATTVEVPTSALAKEMKASGLFTTSGVNAVSLAVKPSIGAITFSSVSTQTGEYASELEATVAGVENAVLLNNRYVLDGLNNFATANTAIQIINGDSPCIFRPAGDGSYLYIVMPIRQ